jgi:hypothetical protein
VFDPAGLGKDLREFLLRHAAHAAVAIEEHGTRARCALVESEDVRHRG